MTLRRLVAPWRTRTARSDDGLTLVEMVVALGIITVLLLSAGGALVALQRTQRFGEATDRATQLAADRVEQIRKVPWGKMGMNPGTPAAPTTPAFPYASEPLVQFTTAGTAPAVLDPVVTDATTKIGANQFTVYTRVTWAPRVTGETNTNVNTNSTKDCRNNYTGVWSNASPAVCTPETPTSLPDDAAKRVTIRVEWNDGPKKRTFDFSSLRYPTIAEAIPTALLVDGQAASRNTCERPAASAWCTLTATEGTVLAPNSGTYKTTIPVTVTGVSKADLTSASATIRSGLRAPSTSALANPSGDKRTWTKTWPVGTIFYPSTTGSWDFTPSTGTADTLTDVAMWTDMTVQASIVPAVGANWIGAYPGSLRADPGHSDPLTAANGSENTAQDFCVKADGTLWNYQTLFFDVRNIDYQDGAASEEPTVTFTGLADPARAGSAISRAALPTYIGHPAWAVTGAATSAQWGTGQVGTFSTVPGVANTMRWYVAFPAGTKFHTATNQTVVTISQTRPGDGATAQTNATIPIRTVATQADCDVVAPTAPTNLVATATGTSVTLTWSADPYATSFKVYKATQTSPSDPLTYTLATTTAAKTYTTTAAASTNVTFYVVASNVHGDSANSATASAATVPTTPPGTVDTTYGNYWGLFENTVLSQAPWYTTYSQMFRSVDGGAPVYMMDGTTYGDGIHYFNRGGSPGPAPGHNYVYTVKTCNAAGCSAAKAGPTERIPLWYGLLGTGGGTIFDWDPLLTAYGSTGAYDFANTYASGADITFSQVPAFGRNPAENSSALFNPTGNLRQFASFTPGPATNAARTIGFMYKESGAFSAGWLFGRAGTTLTNGFSAKNTAAGTIVMNGTTTASWTGLKVNDLAWHYYIFSYDGTNVTLFEDGVNKGAKALVVNTPTTSDLTYNRADGQSPTTGVSGSYEFMNYWTRALTATEALDFYNGRAD